MTILKGRFDGKVVILSGPVPSEIKPNTPVDVVFGNHDASDILGEIVDLAMDEDGLPADFSAQHDHYVKGTPRK